MAETMTFGPLTIGFDERVLRPRPWTYAQSEWAAALTADLPDGAVLELCSGAGHIGLGFADLTGRDVVMVDANPVACEFAERNAAAAGLGDQVVVRCAPMQSALGAGEYFPLAIADPPWVRSDQTGRFPDDPRFAIDGGGDGLHVARLCLDVFGGHLAVGGEAVLQLGDPAQVAGVEAYLDRRPDLGLQVEETRTPVPNGVLVRLFRVPAPTSVGAV